MLQTIPVLKLNDFVGAGSESRAQFARGIGAALTEIGFFALEEHGVPADCMAAAYQAAEKFFLLPEQTKKNYITGRGGQRGYTSFGKEHAKDATAPDLKEFWHVGRDCALSPSEVPEFLPAMRRLYQKLDECSLHLLDAISLFIGEDESFLRDAATDGNTVLRVIHYPPVAPDRNPQSIRAAPHEDINLITLLCEATGAGLELLKKDGTWLPIHSLKGQIIVDAGDMLQQWTNGWIKSTTHRVVNPANDRERRFSMPFFVHPRSEVDISARPHSIAQTGGRKNFPDISSGEYLEKRLREIGLY